MSKRLTYERAESGVHRLWLFGGFALGFGPLTACETPWYDLSKYAWFKRVETTDPDASGWQIRILWVYFGRLTR